MSSRRSRVNISDLCANSRQEFVQKSTHRSSPLAEISPIPHHIRRAANFLLQIHRAIFAHFGKKKGNWGACVRSSRDGPNGPRIGALVRRRGYLISIAAIHWARWRRLLKSVSYVGLPIHGGICAWLSDYWDFFADICVSGNIRETSGAITAYDCAFISVSPLFMPLNSTAAAGGIFMGRCLAASGRGVFGPAPLSLPGRIIGRRPNDAA